MVPRPVEQVLDEVEKTRVRPLHVLERHDNGLDLRHPLEEEPPSCEQVLTVTGIALLETEKVGEAGLDPPTFIGIGNMLGHGIGQFCGSRAGFVSVDDAGSSSYHLGQRPVCDALAVRDAAPPMPIEQVRQTIQVLVELPAEPALANPGDPGNRHEMGPMLLGRGVEQVLDQPELAVATYKRSFEAHRLERPAHTRDDPEGSVEVDQLGLALQRMHALVEIGDRSSRRTFGRLVDIATPRRGDGLHPGSSVDPIADDLAGVRRVCRGSLACHDPHPGLERYGASAAVLRYGSDKLQCRSHRAFGVILVGNRSAPQSHDGIADELLDHTAVARDN